MSMIRPNDWAEPFSPLPTLSNMQREMENLSRAVFGDGHRGESLFVPVDVINRGNDMVVRAEIPGMDPDDIEVNVENGALTIKGERQHEDEQEGDTYYRVERRYGSFFRRIPLPQEVDEDRIEANYSDGVLEVVVPGVATGSSEKKKIPVQQVAGKLKKALGSGRKR